MDLSGIARQKSTETNSPPKGGDPLETLRDRSIYIETYGCRYNFGDTAKLTEVLKYRGNVIVSKPELADAVIINTCTVVGSTERRMLRRLSLFRDVDLYVTGCMPAVQREAILSVCDPTFIPSDMIHCQYRTVRTIGSDSVGIVQIAQGCTGTCSYCITRLARGVLRSYGTEEILAQVGAFIRAGSAEIQLTAQDVSAWGTDTGTGISSLLQALGTLEGGHKIRVGMMNPATAKNHTNELVAAFENDHFFRFIHLPVQSGSDSILDAMGRKYTVAEFEEIVRAFREKYPSITLATDVIVGFPGECEEDFLATVDLIRRIRPDKVNVTRYSRRPFTTPSAAREVPDSVKKDRSRFLARVSSKICTSEHEHMIGTIRPFIVTEILREGSVMARSPEYTGIVLHETLPIGMRGFALLKKDRNYFFIGERVKSGP